MSCLPHLNAVASGCDSIEYLKNKQIDRILYLLLFVLTKCARRPDLAQRFSGKEALAMDLGHEDGRGWYVVQVLWEVKLG